MDCIGLVHGRLLCTLLARVPVAGNASWSKHWRCRLSSVSYCLKMSSAKRLARSFNSWAREGRDLMGGVDGAAIEELLSAYLDDDLGETQPSDCKSNAHYEYSLIIIELGEDDFDSHYNGTHSHFDDDSQCDEVPCDEVPCDEAPCDEAPLFEPEDDLYDPWTPLDLSSQSPSQMLSSASPSQMLSSSPSQMLSSPPSQMLSSPPSQMLSSSSSQMLSLSSTSEPSSLSPSLASSQLQSLLPTSIRPDTISFACRRQELVPVKEKKRPRKPSPPRNRRASSDQQLDEFLLRGCRCARECYLQFDREHYCNKRDEANSLSREELDMVVLGQIMAFISMDNVVGPSHKHAPHQRQITRVKTFFHHGRKICRDTFLALHGIGNNKQGCI